VSMSLQLHVVILMMRSRPLMARLPPFVPYKNSMDVTFRSVASLAPGRMLDTGLLDFYVR